MAVRFVDFDCKFINAPDEEFVIRLIEKAYRICYNSVDKMEGEPLEKAVNFIQHNITRQHTSPLEHVSMSVESTIDRGVLAEITRHRIGSSYSVSSTRYIRYDDKVPCILPVEVRSMPTSTIEEFMTSYESSCARYQNLIANGISPENARSVFPQGLAVNLIETHNLREWFHIFQLRYFGVTGKPHPDMVYYMHKLYTMFQEKYPHIFIVKPELTGINITEFFEKCNNSNYNKIINNANIK